MALPYLSVDKVILQNYWNVPSITLPSESNVCLTISYRVQLYHRQSLNYCHRQFRNQKGLPAFPHDPNGILA